jgi:hypothetical protein
MNGSTIQRHALGNSRSETPFLKTLANFRFPKRWNS